MPGSIKRRPTTEEFGDLKIVTINVPLLDLKVIDRFINVLTITPSRSEYCRIAIKNQIEKDIKIMEKKQDIAKLRGRYDPTKFVYIPNYNGDRAFRILRRLE